MDNTKAKLVLLDIFCGDQSLFRNIETVQQVKSFNLPSPLQTFSLVQSSERSVRVRLMVIDGGSHEQEGGIGSIHTLRHLLVQISNDSIPEQKQRRESFDGNLWFWFCFLHLLASNWVLS